MPRIRSAISCPRSAAWCAIAPPAGEGIRVDTGVYEGAEISLYYDPMIAKLVAYGATRDAAIERLARGARRLLHRAACRTTSRSLPRSSRKRALPRRRALDQSSSPRNFPAGFTGAAIRPADEAQAIAVAAAAQRIAAEHEARIGGQVAGRGRAVPEAWTVCRGDARHAVRDRSRTARPSSSTAASAVHRITTDWQPWQPVFEAAVDGATRIYQIDARRHRLSPVARGDGASTLAGAAAARRRAAGAHAGEAGGRSLAHLLLSPMPGLLVSLAVGEGQEVKAGEEIAVIEAMKMENVLRAERDGKVAKLRAKPGDSLAVDQIILEFA